MSILRRLMWQALAFSLPFVSGCSDFHEKTTAEACVNVDDSSLPPGIFIGQNFKEARQILGKPLQKIDGDFSISGGAIITLIFPSFDIRMSTVTGEIVGEFEWTKPGTGPNSDLLLGKPLRGPIGHGLIYRGMFGDENEVPTIAVCPKPYVRKMRIVYSLKDGKLDHIYLDTWKWPW